MELWGEGQSFFDIKRLNDSVNRDYQGTNFYSSAAFNTNGRPAWMNICIVQTEKIVIVLWTVGRIPILAVNIDKYKCKRP